MAPRQLIFTDDLIVRAGPGGNEEMGVVDRAPNSSDEDSGIDDDDIIDDTEEQPDGKLPPGAARVRWRSQEALKTEQTSSLRLADRVFLLGDIVARASDQLGQTGIVTGMRMFCDVRCGETVLRRLRRAARHHNQSRARGHRLVIVANGGGTTHTPRWVMSPAS